MQRIHIQKNDSTFPPLLVLLSDQQPRAWHLASTPLSPFSLSWYPSLTRRTPRNLYALQYWFTPQPLVKNTPQPQALVPRLFSFGVQFPNLSGW